MSWIASLGLPFWLRLAALVPGKSAAALRTACLRAANISASCLERKALSVARGLPWSLVRGDIGANLDALLEAPAPKEPTALKIRRLLELGYGRLMLVEGIERLGDVHWSTTIVEQGHGSAAVVHKVHRQYGLNMLCQRAMIHMTRGLFPAPAEEAKDQRSQQRLTTLSKKQPQKISGRQVFMKDCMEVASEGPKKERGAKGQAVMRLHSSLWEALPDRDKMQYERRASRLAEQRKEEVEAEVVAVMAAQAARSLSGDRMDAAGQLRLSGCRFSVAELDALATLHSSLDFSLKKVQELRKAAAQAPAVPEAALRARLEEIAVPDAAEKNACQPWLRTLCWGRDSFASTALVFVTAGVERVFAFLYATQSPLAASFLPLVRRDSSFRPMPSGTPPQLNEVLGDFFDHDFDCQWGKTVTEDNVAAAQDTVIYVLPDIAFLGGTRVVSHAFLVPLDEYVKGLDNPIREPKKTAKAKAERPELGKLQAQCEYSRKVSP